ncbi:MAG: hypothetical protein O3B74_06090 [Proteobacteria bacterium]|nr:hypothetical protein [Pseudomonadota bacterium]MDA1311195.1 hypothetical protein [Pseudomonadota bacterium]
MQNRNLLLAALVVGALIVSNPAEAATIQCGDHGALAKHLQERFSETLSASASDALGRQVEFYRSQSGTWTLVVILAEGPACIVSAGDN